MCEHLRWFFCLYSIRSLSLLVCGSGACTHLPIIGNACDRCTATLNIIELERIVLQIFVRQTLFYHLNWEIYLNDALDTSFSFDCSVIWAWVWANATLCLVSIYCWNKMSASITNSIPTKFQICPSWWPFHSKTSKSIN